MAPSSVQQAIGQESRWTWIYLLGHNPNVDQSLKPLRWIASAKKDLMAMPDEVQQTFGFALYHAQIGSLHPNAKPLKGFGSAGVLEVVEDCAVIHTEQCIQSDLLTRFMCCTASRRNRSAASRRPNEKWI